MCNDTEMVSVKIPADLSCSGESKWKNVSIDKCIARIVKALQTFDIDMRGSCCGHNRDFGSIHLQDGRLLLILDKENAKKLYVKINPEIRIKDLLDV